MIFQRIWTPFEWLFGHIVIWLNGSIAKWLEEIPGIWKAGIWNFNFSHF